MINRAIVNRTVDIAVKKELDTEYLINSTVNLVADALKYGDAISILEKIEHSIETNTNIIELGSLLRPDQKRSKKELDELFRKLEYVTSRDLIRIIGLYNWINGIDNRLTNGYVLGVDIKEQALYTLSSISKEMYTSNSNNYLYNFRIGDTFEYSDAYYIKAIGAIYPKIVKLEDNIQSVTVIPNRPVYDTNIYEKYSDKTFTTLDQSTMYFDDSNERLLLNVVISLKEALPTVISINTNKMFTIENIYSTTATNTELNIFNEVMGRNVKVKDDIISITPDSLLIQNNTYDMSFIVPSGTSSIKFVISMNSSESIIFTQKYIEDSFGKIVKEYDIKESLILNRDIVGKEYEEDINRLLLETEGEILKDRSIIKEVKSFVINNITAKKLLSIYPSYTRFKTISSTKKIEKVIIYADTVDPSNNIKFFIRAGSERIEVTLKHGEGELSFIGELPIAIQVEVDILNNNPLYISILHGIYIVVQENDL